MMWPGVYRRWRGPATIALAAYFVVWIGLEGRLWTVLLLAVLTELWTAASIWTRLVARVATAAGRAILAVALGALLGGACAPLTVLLMALKTGLHAHGPEFSPGEIAWVLAQAPRWLIVGALAGGGAWLLAAGLARR